MGSFLKKISEFFFGNSDGKESKTYVPMKQDELLPPADSHWMTREKNFRDLCNRSLLGSLFVLDSIPAGALPVYDLDGGEKTIITIKDGKPEHLKTDWSRITLQLQETITEQNIIDCLLLAAKLAEPTDYVEQYARSGGWASVSGNKLENRLYNNVYIKDFPRTLLLPEQEFFGLICQGTANGIFNGMGLFILMEKVRVVREN